MAGASEEGAGVTESVKASGKREEWAGVDGKKGCGEL